MRAVDASAHRPRGKDPIATILSRGGFSYRCISMGGFCGPMTLSRFKVSCFSKFFFVKVECGNNTTRETCVLGLKNGHEPDRPSGYYAELVSHIAKTSVSHGNCGSFAQYSLSSRGRRLLPGCVSLRDHCAPLN